MTGPAIIFDQLSLNYGRSQILSKISFRTEPGTIHAIVGPNGGGKSTLLKSLLGQTAFNGVIQLDWATSQAGVIAYVPQSLDFDHGLPITVLDFLAILCQQRPAIFPAKAEMKNKYLAALEKVGMASKSTRRMGALSGGERQRVLLAQALIPVPDLLVLDEPMTALDEAGVETFSVLIQELKQQGTTILWVEHDIEAVRRYADRVTGLACEIIFDGQPQAVLSPETLLSLFSTHRQKDVNGEK